jgi:nitroreductase
MDADDFFEVLATQRAIRLFSDRPVDDATIERLIASATRAPNGRNEQKWHFIVVRERETKRKLGKIFDELGEQLYGADAPERTPWEDVPVLIVICFAYNPDLVEVSQRLVGASVFPAAQNLLLSAHALGLGSVLTTRFRFREAEVKSILGLPDSLSPWVILPIGWPAKKYGRSRRKPVPEITSRETYGRPW